MALSQNAQKLLAWFGLYQTTATAYDYNLTHYFPRAQRRGAFADALDELVNEGY